MFFASLLNSQTLVAAEISDAMHWQGSLIVLHCGGFASTMTCQRGWNGLFQCPEQCALWFYLQDCTLPPPPRLPPPPLEPLTSYVCVLVRIIGSHKLGRKSTMKKVRAVYAWVGARTHTRTHARTHARTHTN